MTVVGLVATFGMNFQVLIPPLADDVLDVGASGLRLPHGRLRHRLDLAALWIAFSQRVGPRPIVVGAIALGRRLDRRRASRRRSRCRSLAMVVVGAGGIGMAVTANTTIQMSVPDHLRGRVMSLYTTVFAGPCRRAAC